MKNLLPSGLLSVSFALGLSQSAVAGNLAPVQSEAPVIPPAPPVIASDWTGFYTGLQLGFADLDGPDPLDGNNTAYGFHAGYDYDLGNWVIGGEIDYDQTDVDLDFGAATVDSVARLKVKGGYDLGDTLIYATAGVARADTSLGDETGPFAGLGISYRINDRYAVGAEVLEHQFDDLGGVAGNDVDATTLTVRGSLRF